MSSEIAYASDSDCPHLIPRRRLPPELIDAIFDHLHDDKASLKIGRLVCKTWARSACFHLFSSLEVHGLVAKRFLESAPAIIRFIRHLTLRQQEWNETLPLLVGFESIESLFVSGLPIHRLNAQALSALHFNFSAAVDVELDNIEFATAGQLIHLICAFPSLQRLSISCTNTDLDDFTIDLPGLSTLRLSPHLRDLELDHICMDAVLDWYLSLTDRPPLHTVGLHSICPHSSDAVAKLLLALADSLISFSISTYIGDGLYSPFDLRHNTHLRSLRFELNGEPDGSQVVTQTLSQVSSPHIEEVELEFIIDYLDDSNMVGDVEWGEIDAALQHSSFSGLRTVTVRVLQLDGSGTVVPHVTDRMPGCEARGILRVFDVEY